MLMTRDGVKNVANAHLRSDCVELKFMKYFLCSKATEFLIFFISNVQQKLNAISIFFNSSIHKAVQIVRSSTCRLFEGRFTSSEAMVEERNTRNSGER